MAYPLPYEWKERLGVRRYGFHGASHRAASERAQELLGRMELRRPPGPDPAAIRPPPPGKAMRRQRSRDAEKVNSHRTEELWRFYGGYLIN